MSPIFVTKGSNNSKLPSYFILVEVNFSYEIVRVFKNGVAANILLIFKIPFMAP